MLFYAYPQAQSCVIRAAHRNFASTPLLSLAPLDKGMVLALSLDASKKEADRLLDRDKQQFETRTYPTNIEMW